MSNIFCSFLFVSYIQSIIAQIHFEHYDLKVIHYQNKFQLEKQNTAFVKQFGKFLVAEIYAFNKRFKFIAFRKHVYINKLKLTHHYFEDNLYRVNNTKVCGYLHKNVFLGYIKAFDDVFHLESKTIGNNNDEKIIMYSESSSKIQQESINNIKMNFVRKKRVNYGIYNYFRAKLKFPLSNRMCRLKVSVTQTFKNKWAKKDLRKAYNEAIVTVSLASEIFERTDFDGDGEPDGINLHVAQVNKINVSNIIYVQRHQPHTLETLKSAMK